MRPDRAPGGRAAVSGGEGSRLLNTPMPALPRYSADLITRQMCATAHLDADFAREVLEEYTSDRIQSVGLPFGVNLVALVRHARLSAERRDQRDHHLLLLQGLLLLLVLAMIGTLGQQQASVSEFLFVSALAVFPFGTAIVFRTEWAIRRSVLDLKDGAASPQQLAPAADPALESELKSLRSANMVVYGLEAEAQNPFVGSGWRITESVWSPFDISKPAQSPGGGALAPVPFTAADLHHHLAKAMSRATGLSELRSRNRLYVRGPNVASLGADALPDPTRKPLASIPSRYVKSGASQSGGGMETYLCLWVSGDGGRVLVSMHLKALLHRPMLSWEVAAYVLPPLGPRFKLPAEFAASESRLRWHAALASLRLTGRGVLGAAARLLRRRSRAAERARTVDRARREILRGYRGHDYGSTNSLRERAAHWDEMGYSERRDAQKCFKLMVQGVLTCTAEFLESRNVDTTDLTHQQQQIVSLQTYTFNGAIGQVQAGNHGQLNVHQGAQPQAPPGGGVGAGAPGSGGPAGAAAPAGLI